MKLITATLLAVLAAAPAVAQVPGEITLRHPFVVCRSAKYFKPPYTPKSLPGLLKSGKCRRFAVGDQIRAVVAETGQPAPKLWARVLPHWVVPYSDLRTEVMDDE
jgi:hypothetical protein